MVLEGKTRSKPIFYPKKLIKVGDPNLHDRLLEEFSKKDEESFFDYFSFGERKAEVDLEFKEAYTYLE